MKQIECNKLIDLIDLIEEPTSIDLTNLIDLIHESNRFRSYRDLIDSDLIQI